MTTAAVGAKPNRVSFLTMLLFGPPGLALAGFLLIAGVYLPRFYVGLGVPFLATAAALGLVRLFDIFIDPILGLLIDRTNTPLGRFRPWLLLGAPIVMVGLYELLVAPVPQTSHLILWMIVTYVGYSMTILATVAWGATLATDYGDRARVYGWTQGMAVVGSVGLLLLGVLTHNRIVLGKQDSMPTIGWILIYAFPIGAIICSLFTRENLSRAQARPRFSLRDYAGAIARPTMRRVIFADLLLTLGPATTAPIYVYFFKDAKGFSVGEVGLLLLFYIAAGIPGAPFWGAVASRLGKHRTIQIACVTYAISQTVLMAIPRVWPGHSFAHDGLPTAIGMAAVGFCASAFLALIRAMVADVIDEVKLDTGQDLTGLLYSMVTTTAKIAAAISVTIIFPVLAAVGYNGKEGALNTPHSIFGLEMCYLFAPIILVFIGGGTMFGYKLDNARHAAIRDALEQRTISASIDGAGESLTGVGISPEPAE
jgi:GPH family glycoside/pentoside/hexuronide:cation symporter